MKKSYIFISFILIILIAGGYLYFKSLKTSNTPLQTNQTKKQRVLPKEAMVTLDKHAFIPSVVTV